MLPWNESSPSTNTPFFSVTQVVLKQGSWL